MPDYLYDMFFSYKRDEQTNSWHAEVVAKIKYWLSQEIDSTEVRIFFDTESIETGDRWHEKIAESLKKSKCLVAIWSPDYFRSRWCLSEWKSFLSREEKYNLKGTLIVPARCHDGKRFPDLAQQTQSEDFRPYFSTMDFFWKTEDAYVFEKEKLKSFATTIASRIKSAPNFNAEFPVEMVDPQDVPSFQRITRVGM